MTILIYSKLEIASGNATLATRLHRILEGAGETVLLRALPPELPEDAEALNREIETLRQQASAQRITLVIGIHCYRAGAVLQQAFGSTTPRPLPYLLIASGTDLNADLQNISCNATLCAAIADSAGVATLSPELQIKAQELLAHLNLNHPVEVTHIPQAPDLPQNASFSLKSVLGLQQEQKLILLPAGLRPVKDVRFAIEAMAQALIDHPDHVFAVLGPRTDAQYHAQCASLMGEWRLRHRSLKGRMHLLDGLSRADYLGALREADLLLNTSTSEAVSNAVLEALGAGIPVLAKDIPGNRFVIQHEENGLLFEGLPAFLKEYRRLFADPGLRHRLTKNGYVTYAQMCNPEIEETAYHAWVSQARPSRR